MWITANLATRPYTDLGPALKLLRISMAVLVVIAIGLGLGLRALHQKAEEARATELRVQKQIDAINMEEQGYQAMMRQPENAQLLDQVKALNKIFDDKTFSWTLAMEDLETVLPSGVQVASLDPVRDSKDGHITLKLRVVGPRDHADDLVENLEHSRHFLLPHIVSESSESSGDRNQRLEPVSTSNRFTFELLADYNPAVSVDRKAERKQEKQQNKKSSADGERISQSAPPDGAVHPVPKTLPSHISPVTQQAPLVRPVQPQTALGQRPPWLPNNGLQRLRPNRTQNQNSIPNQNPGGQQ
ncbi:MAG: hypothetical protein ABR906_04490 [Terracidiphilus sp.]|jgi:type IV pilus assembly protein PilN